MRSKLRWIAPMFLLASVLAACGGDDADSGSGTDGPRTIEIAALDELAYEPASVEVTAGEAILFVVTNEGENEHEFVVGDAEMQEMAEEQAMEGMHGHVEAMATLLLPPGETAETTVTFDEPGELSYACHLARHFEGGMVGTITVSSPS